VSRRPLSADQGAWVPSWLGVWQARAAAGCSLAYGWSLEGYGARSGTEFGIMGHGSGKAEEAVRIVRG
jgi:hypothetical protein